MDCFHQTLVQVWICFFSPIHDNKDGRINGRRLSVWIHRGHSNLVILNRITYISYMVYFHQILVTVRIWVFFPTKDHQDGRQNGTAYQFASVRCYDHSNLVIFILISSNFHIWIASTKLWFKFEYEFCLTIDSQDDWQNGCRLPVCSRGHPTFKLALLPDCFQISYMDYFYQTLTNQDGLQNGRNLSVCTSGHSNLVIHHPISSKFHTYYFYHTLAELRIWALSDER